LNAAEKSKKQNSLDFPVNSRSPLLLPEAKLDFAYLIAERQVQVVNLSVLKCSNPFDRNCQCKQALPILGKPMKPILAQFEFATTTR
jgi:hypothetical protein